MLPRLATQQSEAASLQEEVNSLGQTLTNISASLATLSDEIASFEQTSVQQSQDLELLELQQAEGSSSSRSLMEARQFRSIPRSANWTACVGP